MTIKELVYRLTHVTLVNPNDLTSSDVVLDENIEIGKIIILGNKKMIEKDFDKVFSIPTLYPENTVNIYLKLDSTCDYDKLDGTLIEIKENL
jgi:hypothetical protein